MRDASWLCPTPGHRERFLEMHERLRVARILTIVIGGGLMVAVLPKASWTLSLLFAVMVTVVVLGGSGLARRRKPELWVFGSAVLNLQLGIAVIAVMTGGPRTTATCLLVIPVILMAARFSNRGLVVGAPISAAMIVAATVGVDPAYVLHNPESVGVPLALVVAVVAYISPLVTSDVRHRTASTLDELTGLLNRRALQPRFVEVAEQAALAGSAVSLVSIDIDHFKLVNDEHGHAMGDAVLREVAAALRQELRTFELLYRIGGEEFLLLLPGADQQIATQIAATLRAAVEGLRPAGIPVTCSFGVATAYADAIAYAPLMKAADGALYDAKRLGRNRVEPHAPVLSAAA
jgi:diguanylate cyclase (GGDEF)-like protein